MKSIVILYDSNSDYADQKAFSGKSARERTLAWAENFASKDCIVKLSSCESVCKLLEKMSKLAKEKEADTIIFSFDDLPFINVELTEKLTKQHSEYHSEYTFADGYPYGFTPEVINAGSIAIMAKLAETNLKEAGLKPVSRSCIYDFIKSDINSFEVETLIAPSDWRLLRLSFSTASKSDFLSSSALSDIADSKLSADELAKIASVSLPVLKSLPKFYSIQISDKVNFRTIYSPLSAGLKASDKMMAYEDFESLINQIVDLSKEAVISLSVYGEPLTHPDFLKFVECVLSKKNLCLFIESDGLLVSPELCEGLKTLVEKYSEKPNLPYPKFMMALQLDAVSASCYKIIHEKADDTDFQKALQSVSMLSQALPGCIYPQFVRMNENEAELEAFFRYWNEKTSPTAGNFIIQKYDSMAGALPERKPADLSPLERNVCWHLRRDMTILSDGTVPACRACLASSSLGNVFKEDLESVWHKNDDILKEQIEKKLSVMCGKCDEFYTFNF